MEIFVDGPGLTTAQECKALEAYETDSWASDAVLKVETLRGRVLDPCAGFGMLGRAFREAKSATWEEWDIKPWWKIKDRSSFDGWSPHREVRDFLDATAIPYGVQTVIMNPPFSLATDFVDHARRLGAGKIICFQRHSWWESQGRAEFWARNPPNRIYSCRKRATCLRFDIITGDAPIPNGGTTTAHSWFVWEEGHPHGTLMCHV